MIGFILFLLLPGDGTAPDVAALLAALRQEVGEQTEIVVERYSENPTVAGLRARREALGARFGAFVASDGDAWKSARVVLVGEDIVAPPLVRLLDFRPADPPRERARAIGLLLAAMMREKDPSIPLPPAVRPATPPETRPLPPRKTLRHRLGVAATSFRATNEGAWALGAEADWRAHLTARWMTRVGLLASRGELNSLPGRIDDVGIRLAAGVRLWEVVGKLPVAVHACLGALLLREAVTRRNEDELRTIVRWKPATSFDLELEARPSSGLVLLARVGLDLHPVGSRVTVDGQGVASTARARPTAALGIGWAF